MGDIHEFVTLYTANPGHRRLQNVHVHASPKAQSPWKHTRQEGIIKVTKSYHVNCWYGEVGMRWWERRLLGGESSIYG